METLWQKKNLFFQLENFVVKVTQINDFVTAQYATKICYRLFLNSYSGPNESWLDKAQFSC